METRILKHNNATYTIHNIYSLAILLPGLFFTFFAISKIPHIKIVKIYLKLKQRKGDLKNE